MRELPRELSEIVKTLSRTERGAMQGQKPIRLSREGASMLR